MTKTNTVKKMISVITVLSILVCSFCIFGATTANAASDTVKMYSTETYFCKYGMTGTYVYVQTKDNASNQKVTVHYNYLQGQEWRDSDAEYFTTLDDGSKLWKAYITSYNTEYAIRYVADGVTTWDNNNGKNYTSESIGSAVITANRGGVVYAPFFNFSATLKNLAYHKDVKVRYTVNNWASYKDLPMSYSKTNADGTELWTAVEKEGTYSFNYDTSGFQYAISYTVNGTTYWANNFNNNYDATYRVYP